jgi:NADH:ubiquinone oxidoreductase subunit 6 (subunit J)
MLGTELALFIIVGALAILAAVMMLISENAVHSALFLIVNFACVAFLYLMLNAPFLFAVQITVYTGAIMVLFLFVIMLMGAERVLPQETAQFPWLAPAAAGITIVLLFVAGLAIIRSDIDASEPEPSQPIFRFVHAVAGVGAVDVYLNGERVVEDLDYREASDFEEFPAGSYTAQVVPHPTEEGNATANIILETPVFLAANGVISYVLTPDSAGGVEALQVEGRLDPNDEKDFSRLTVVHAIPCADACPIEVADVTIPGDDPYILAENIEHGQSARFEIKEGTYTLAAYPVGSVKTALDTRQEDERLDLDPLVRIDEHTIEQNTGVLWVVTQDTTGTVNRPQILWFSLDNNAEFGSARGIGQLLFTDYLLPFEVIGILLLTAMVGVIVLTKPHEKPKKARARRRMANVAGNPTVEEYMQTLQRNAADSSGD